MCVCVSVSPSLFGTFFLYSFCWFARFYVTQSSMAGHGNACVCVCVYVQDPEPCTKQYRSNFYFINCLYSKYNLKEKEEYSAMHSNTLFEHQHYGDYSIYMHFIYQLYSRSTCPFFSYSINLMKLLLLLFFAQLVLSVVKDKQICLSD